MANVHVREIPDEVHAALKQRAAADGRSLNDVIVRLLTQSATRPTPAEFAARLRERGFDEPAPAWPTIADAAHDARSPR